MARKLLRRWTAVQSAPAQLSGWRERDNERDLLRVGIRGGYGVRYVHFPTSSGGTAVVGSKPRVECSVAAR